MLCGREQLVESVFADLAAGHSCFLVGPAGIGKTALLDELCRTLGPRARRGQAFEPLSWMSHLPLLQAFGDLPARAPGELAEYLAGALADSVLVLDDLHWADDDTLAVLDALGSDAVILGALRADEPEGREALGLARRLGAIVDMTPVDAVTAREIAIQANPGLSDDQLDRVAAAGEGNPLFVMHLALEPTGDDQGHGSRLAARIARLPPPAREGLALLALLGRPGDPLLLGDAATELVNHGVAKLTDGGMVPEHDLLARAALGLIDPDRVPALHARVASWTTDPGERARHLFRAGDLGGAATLALEAAHDTATPAERADHLHLAVEATRDPDVELVIGAAEALAAVGRHYAAVDLVSALPSAAGPLELRRRVVEAHSMWAVGDYAAVRTVIEEGLALATGTDPRAEIRFLSLAARLAARIDWDVEEALRCARHAVELAETTGEELAAAHSCMGSALLLSASDDWRRHLYLALEAAIDSGEDDDQFIAADTLFMAELLFGRPTVARKLAEEFEGRAVGCRSPMWSTQHRKNALLAAFHVDDEVDRTLAQGTQMLEVVDHQRTRDHLESVLTLAHADRGDDEAAQRVLLDAVGLHTDDATTRAMWLWSKAEADWLAGRYEDAIEAADECARLPVGGFPASTVVAPIGQWARHDLGREPGPALPGVLFTNLEPAIEETAAVAELATDPELAARRFEHACRGWRRISVRAARRCHWARGEALRLAGDRAGAAEVLWAARHEVTAAGNLPLRRRIDQSLRLCGEHPIAPSADEEDGRLTSSQHEVLELVARGLDTEAIARRLAVSPHTVESHIRTAMQRLLARTRLEAAVIAATPRADPGKSDLPLLRCRADDLPDIARDLAARGLDVRDLGQLPTRPWDLSGRRLVATGRVDTLDQAVTAVQAVLRHAGLVVSVCEQNGSPDAARIQDLLGRIAPLELAETDDTGTADLDETETGLLGLLAGGRTVAGAAAELNMSRRTADRRLASARAKLGASTTAEAVAIHEHR